MPGAYNWTRFRSTNETESGETCSTTVTGMRWRWSGWSRIWKAWPELLHVCGRLGLNKPNGYLLGSYRIATAPEPNSSRLTSLKSTRFDSRSEEHTSELQ